MNHPNKSEEMTASVLPMEKKQECSQRAECMKMIQLVLDGEGTPEQIERVSQNIGKCLPCEKGYALEKNIKEALQLRLEKKSVPASLLDSIRSRVSSIKLFG
ncbi:MAG: hypothetical protein LH606_01285 [Cytophagaceae bacterium]|nr:hypothetical protein [Cytophagaceae bacterium]